MPLKNTIQLTIKDLKELNEALHYLKMAELKALCKQYQLPFDGPKVTLISRIITFVKTGEVLTTPTIPASSRPKKGESYPLTPHTLILYGSYKNDAKTRAFFKKLIGDHFHFTAFGIDWLNDRWLAGNPPTYAEFAAYWQQEYAARKLKPVSPKKEWAYINFTQQFLTKNPTASKQEIIKAWEDERQCNVKKVKKILNLL